MLGCVVIFLEKLSIEIWLSILLKKKSKKLAKSWSKLLKTLLMFFPKKKSTQLTTPNPNKTRPELGSLYQTPTVHFATQIHAAMPTCPARLTSTIKRAVEKRQLNRNQEDGKSAPRRSFWGEMQPPSIFAKNKWLTEVKKKTSYL